jgi:CBS domain-containing protein
MKAKDIMIPLSEYLHPDDSVKDAVNYLSTAKRSEERVGVKGAPVLDKDHRVVGMISMSDILRAARPTYLNLSNIGQFTWEGMLTTVSKRIVNKKVKDIMATDVKTVREESSLMGCVDLLLKNRIKRLPVLDKEGKVIGMVYERDIFFAVIHGMFDDLVCYDASGKPMKTEL